MVLDPAENRPRETCDRPDFIFRRDGLAPRSYYHIRAMRAVGLLRSDRLEGQAVEIGERHLCGKVDQGHGRMGRPDPFKQLTDAIQIQ
jgi:hypothetical protein